jgi:multidrug resistance protein, MATE family
MPPSSVYHAKLTGILPEIQVKTTFRQPASSPGCSMINLYDMLGIMKNRDSDVTIGSLWSNIYQLSWPMFLIMVLNFFVGLTDIYVAGLISPEVQAAVGFVGQLYFLTIIVANAISIGSLALVSRAIGAGDTANAVETVRQSLIFSFIVAVLLTAAGFFFYREIIAVSGFPLRIRELSEHFFRIFALSLGPNYILIVSNAIFRASGEVKKPLLTMLLVSCINIVGDFVLVFGAFTFPGMGYTGIALSTTVSMAAGMMITLGFFRYGRWKTLYSGPWTIVTDAVKKIVRLGWPAAMLQIAWNAGSIVLYTILGRLGEESVTALAAITNGLRIEAIIYLPAFALNMAASVLIGQNLGARNAGRAEKLGWNIALTGVVLMSSMAIIIFLWAKSLASVLTTNAAVLEETTRYLRINMASEPFMALSVVLAGGLQGAGDTKGTMWIIIFAMWFIRLPLAYFLAVVMDYGAAGVWTAMVVSMTVQGIFMAQRFHKGRWKTLQLG